MLARNFLLLVKWIVNLDLFVLGALPHFELKLLLLALCHLKVRLISKFWSSFTTYLCLFLVLWCRRLFDLCGTFARLRRLPPHLLLARPCCWNWRNLSLLSSLFGDRRLFALLGLFCERLELLLRMAIVVGRTRRFWPQDLIFLPTHLMLLATTLLLRAVAVKYSIGLIIVIVIAAVPTCLRIVETRLLRCKHLFHSPNIVLENLHSTKRLSIFR